MADLSVFSRIKTKGDYDREAAAFDLKRRLAQGQNPAAIKIADELQRARNSGDSQRVNDILTSAKMFDRGIVMDANGNPVAMENYGQALGSIAGAKAGAEQNAKNVSDLNYKPIIEGQKTREKIISEDQANAENDLPRYESQAQQMSQVINDIKSHPGLSSVVGAPNPLGGRIPLPFGLGGNIPGSPAADFQAKLDQLGGKNFLEAFQSLKGGGQITEIEGQKATDAIASMQTSQSEEAFLKSLGDLEQIVKTGLERAQRKASIPAGQYRNPTSFPTMNAADFNGNYAAQNPSPAMPPAMSPSSLPPALPTPVPQLNPSNIPMSAVQYLRQNPNLKADFDRKYGAGASALVLGQ